MTDFEENLWKAIELHSEYRNYDPLFDEIDSALLNKEDIKKYVERTGMLYPFYPDDE